MLETVHPTGPIVPQDLGTPLKVPWRDPGGFWYARRTMRSVFWSLIVAVLVGCSGSARPYPLDTCLVGDEKLGDPDDIVILQHEGREVRLCCPACIDIFKKDSAKYLRKLDEAERKQAERERRP
jgi:hypothetical protein